MWNISGVLSSRILFFNARVLKEMKKVLLLQHTKSRYNVLASMTQSLHKALRRQGVDATLFEDWSKGPHGVVECVENEGFDFTCAINIAVPDSFLYDRLGVEHIYLSVDSFAHMPREIAQMQHGVVLFVDECSRDLFSKRHTIPAYYCPHAIAKESIQNVCIPTHKRPFDVVLLGSFIDYEAELTMWKGLFRASDVEGLLSLAERALEESSFLFQAEAFRYVEKTPEILLKLDKNGLSISDLVASVERYIRGVDKKNVLRALQGRDIHIFSEEGAERWNTYAPHCICHPPVAFSDIGEVLSQAKIVINSTPSIRQGFHERLFLGLNCGATVLTSQLSHVPAWLEEKGLVVGYTKGSLSHIQERITSPQRNEAFAGEIWSWLEKEHTWDVRVRDIFSIFLK